MPHPLVKLLFALMQKAAHPEKAKPMRAYMKTDQPFYGIPAEPRRKLFMQVAKKYHVQSLAEYEQIVLELWSGTYREDMYQAIEAALRFKKFYSIDAWPLYVELMNEAPNWDTLDLIAGKIMSPLLLKYPELEDDVSRWIDSENFWARRAALLVRIKHKQNTDTARLSKAILHLAHEQEFFIGKAIGWILREYAKTNPQWVRNFVNEYESRLSNLSRREALKNLK